jgi:hypothetical protein
MSFSEIQQMLRTESDDPRDWKHKSRGPVLWLWHTIKLDLYYEAVGLGYGEVEKK